MFKGKFIHVLFILTAFIAGAAGNAFADFTVKTGETFTLSVNETLTVDDNLTIEAT